LFAHDHTSDVFHNLSAQSKIQKNTSTHVAFDRQCAP
jgi:hypothetical protein